ncbi:hypothetical protein LAZ67_8001854 [Cordylochernes scorpioides]|uniref:Uncharacterized protein n=1 Tax=Cordylochernes scorpioides TaxID=51811 RepID=A0ABY6KQL2_9ARAC|nr:hypothetical protein LAZ67_8001854 [Cordylochernes scorpioides]
MHRNPEKGAPRSTEMEQLYPQGEYQLFHSMVSHRDTFGQGCRATCQYIMDMASARVDSRYTVLTKRNSQDGEFSSTTLHLRKKAIHPDVPRMRIQQVRYLMKEEGHPSRCPQNEDSAGEVRYLMEEEGHPSRCPQNEDSAGKQVRYLMEEEGHPSRCPQNEDSAGFSRMRIQQVTYLMKEEGHPSRCPQNEDSAGFSRIQQVRFLMEEEGHPSRCPQNEDSAAKMSHRGGGNEEMAGNIAWEQGEAGFLAGDGVQ